MVILFFFLHLNPHPHAPFWQSVKEFDLIGLGIIVVGVVCLLIGFNFSETSCTCLTYSNCLSRDNHVFQGQRHRPLRLSLSALCC